MSDPRWTDETVELFAATLHAWATEDAGGPAYPDEDAEVQERCRDGARRFLAALADAGLLVQPGGTTWVRWSAVDKTGRELAPTEERARDLLMHYDPETRRVEHQTVHEGPWQPTTQEAP